jgi:hypothetical protein
MVMETARRYIEGQEFRTAFLEDLVGGRTITPELDGVHKQLKALGASDDLETLQRRLELHAKARILAPKGSALAKHHAKQKTELEREVGDEPKVIKRVGGEVHGIKHKYRWHPETGERERWDGSKWAATGTDEGMVRWSVGGSPESKIRMFFEASDEGSTEGPKYKKMSDTDRALYHHFWHEVSNAKAEHHKDLARKADSVAAAIADRAHTADAAKEAFKKHPMRQDAAEHMKEAEKHAQVSASHKGRAADLSSKLGKADAEHLATQTSAPWYKKGVDSNIEGWRMKVAARMPSGGYKLSPEPEDAPKAKAAPPKEAPPKEVTKKAPTMFIRKKTPAPELRAENATFEPSGEPLASPALPPTSFTQKADGKLDKKNKKPLPMSKPEPSTPSTAPAAKEEDQESIPLRKVGVTVQGIQDWCRITDKNSKL